MGNIRDHEHYGAYSKFSYRQCHGKAQLRKQDRCDGSCCTARTFVLTAPTVPIFVSPGAVAEAKAKKLEQKKPLQTIGQRNSVGYVQTFVGPQRRPRGKMPIEVHAEVGALLKSVLVDSYHRKGVYNRVNSVRSELDEWTQREYNHDELPNERFFELYYHESSATFSRSLPVDERRLHIDSLERVKQILSSHYPDCPPLRSLVGKVDSAIKSMQTWAS